uniref:Calcium load-activated calcium channel n=1 Tax=Poecilia reticulata TaxID=8081 RepID=A0A3P9PEL1_POERE
RQRKKKCFLQASENQFERRKCSEGNMWVKIRKTTMSTMFADTILIVFISVCTALLAEGITWVLVYRTEKYKRLKAEVEKQSKKLEKKKETITESAGRQQKKKIERQEEKLKNNNRDLSMVRMKSMFAIGFCFTALMGMFNSIFDGRVVAKLPFVPLSYIQGLSHRNLLGEDYTDCSFIFLYILCTMSIRQNIQKMLGLAPSRAATKQAGGFLGPPPQAAKFS